MTDSTSASVEIEIDLSTGKFHLRATSETAPAILEKMESLFGKYLDLSQSETKDTKKSSHADEVVAGDSAVVAPPTHSDVETKTKKSSVSKGAKTYKPVDLGLDDKQRISIREFFNEKKPSSQEEEVAVITTKIKQLIGKEEFTPDELFTALRIVDRPIPKNLDGVVSNMKLKGRGDRKDGKLVVNHLTEDFVNHHMSPKEQQTK